MSEKLTNQAAGRLCREVEGRCRTAARTQSTPDIESATQLVRELLGSTGPWSTVDRQGYLVLDRIRDYVTHYSFALAAEEAGRAARIFEDNIPSTRTNRAAG